MFQHVQNSLDKVEIKKGISEIKNFVLKRLLFQIVFLHECNIVVTDNGGLDLSLVYSSK